MYSLVGHRDTALVRNFDDCNCFFSLASSKDDSFAAMFILEIKPRGIFVHQGRILLLQQGGHTLVKIWGVLPETRAVVIGLGEGLILGKI